MSVTRSEVGVIKGSPFGKSPSERWLANGHFRAVRYLKCAWGDRYDLVAELGAAGGQLYPHKPSIGARAYAVDPAVGFGRTSAGSAANTIAYEYALIAVYYSTEVPIVSGGWYITEGVRPAREFNTIHPHQVDFRWDALGGDQVLTGLPYHEPRLVYFLKFHNIVAVPPAAATYIGYCNASPVVTYTLGLTFAPETLYHPAPFISITFPLGGVSRYTLEYNWEFNPWGWNKRFNPRANAYQFVYNQTTGLQVIFAPTMNFNLLKP